MNFRKGSKTLNHEDSADFSVSNENKFKKAACRTKERVFQIVGLADKTYDDQVAENITCFNKQLDTALKVKCAILEYSQCIKNVLKSSYALYDAFGECYESNWTGCDDYDAQCVNALAHLSKYSDTLSDEILPQVDAYVNQFTEVKKKIQKRDRKLLDYDNARHSYESTFDTKKNDVVKASKCKYFIHALETYEDINTEILDVLPALYRSRLTFFNSLLQSFYANEASFHQELLENSNECINLLDNLAVVKDDECEIKPPDLGERSLSRQTESNLKPNEKSHAKHFLSSLFKNIPSRSKGRVTVCVPKTSDERCPKTSDLSNLEILYTVKVIFDYAPRDSDELELIKGELIRVIEFDDSDERDDGWLKGVKDNGKIGLFPENFTLRFNKRV